MSEPILLGTVALEPNRWGVLDPTRKPAVKISPWLSAAVDAGFDGIELWEGHLSAASPAEQERVVEQCRSFPVVGFNTYASWETDDDPSRADVVRWLGTIGASFLKFNVGAEAAAVDEYSRRTARLLSSVSPTVRLLCECHDGTAAEDPRVAARVLDQSGPGDRVQAIVHLGDPPARLDARFAAHGPRIRHVHVNFLDERHQAPPLAAIEDNVAARIDLLRSHGYEGSWTIEFSQGVNTTDDRPETTFASAVADLQTLRRLLA